MMMPSWQEGYEEIICYLGVSGLQLRRGKWNHDNCSVIMSFCNFMNWTTLTTRYVPILSKRFYFMCEILFPDRLYPKQEA